MRHDRPGEHVDLRVTESLVQDLHLVPGQGHLFALEAGLLGERDLAETQLGADHRVGFLVGADAYKFVDVIRRADAHELRGGAGSGAALTRCFVDFGGEVLADRFLHLILVAFGDGGDPEFTLGRVELLLEVGDAGVELGVRVGFAAEGFVAFRRGGVDDALLFEFFDISEQVEAAEEGDVVGGTFAAGQPVVEVEFSGGVFWFSVMVRLLRKDG